MIVCTSAPNMRLRVEPGLTISRRGLRRFARQTLFLDGTFSGSPFQDNDRRQYSLDHHAGCVRSVTLATCEQAAVVLATGLPINDGEWTLLVNEPDLDSILAAWVLMNGIELLREVLDALDHLLMPSDLVNELLEYEETSQIRLRGRRIAIICRSAHGIYEVERYLRQRYGTLLGMIVLDQGEGRFTLRLSDEFFFRPLFPLYNALNRIDTNATARDGTINLWGGAMVHTFRDESLCIATERFSQLVPHCPGGPVVNPFEVPPYVLPARKRLVRRGIVPGNRRAGALRCGGHRS